MSRTRLAIEGGEPVRSAPWPPPHAVDEDDERWLRCALKEESWSNGTLVREFERRFAQFCDCRYAVAVTNATEALKLILLASGVGPGDEVIVPGITWPSVPIAIMECGAEPVAADIELETYAVSARTIEPVLSSATKAIIPTHLYCSQADLPPILALAQARRLVVIEDAAQAVGARRDGVTLGAFGHAGIVSFNQKKVLSCGEGGCFITNDSQLFETAAGLREVQADSLVPPGSLATTCKISEFQAAILLSQLGKLPRRLRLIDERIENLRVRLESLDGVRVLSRLSGTEIQVAYSFCFRLSGVDDIVWVRRALAAELGLPVNGTYVPLSDTAALDSVRDRRYRSLGRRLRVRLPNCVHAHYREAVRFPMGALVADEHAVEDIVRAVRRVLAVVRPGT